MDQPLSDIEEYIQFGTPPTTKTDCDFLQALSAAASLSSPRLLDLACGVGRHALEMARRGCDVLGIDLSPDRVVFATAEAARLKLRNCRFVVGDLGDLQTSSAYDLAYSLFNTFSLFVDNDQLVRILRSIRLCLVPDGLLLIQLGSIWSYFAEGSFKNGSYDRTDERGSLTRKVSGRFEFARQNNIYRHHRSMQLICDGLAYPVREETTLQRIFSINEWDLLCRLTGFVIRKVYSRVDAEAEMADYNSFSGTAADRELILLLGRSD